MCMYMYIIISNVYVYNYHDIVYSNYKINYNDIMICVFVVCVPCLQSCLQLLLAESWPSRSRKRQLSLIW